MPPPGLRRQSRRSKEREENYMAKVIGIDLGTTNSVVSVV